MKAMKPNSVDAVVTDPPYGLEFMGKEWDKLIDKRPAYNERIATHKKDGRHGGGNNPYVQSRVNYQAGLDMQLWHTQWLTEVYRVLKPGGSMLVMGGTRTFHRLACAIEDSGFIIKDTLMWLYGSGFPKAQDLGKMIDKRNGRKAEDFKQLGKYLQVQRKKKNLSTIQLGEYFKTSPDRINHGGCVSNWELGLTVPTISQWEILKRELSLNNKFDWLIKREEAEREKIGEDKHWGKAGNSIGIGGQEWDLSLAETSLAKYWDGFKVGGIKPAYEPIIWAVKPPEGSYIDNILKYGVGAVNVPETRISAPQGLIKGGCTKFGGAFGNSPEHKITNPEGNSKGRFPANVILSHHPECEQVGMKETKSDGNWIGKDLQKYEGWGMHHKDYDKKDPKINPDGYEKVESWKCVENCPIRILNEQSGDCPSKQGGGNSGEQRTGFLSGANKIYGNKRNDNGGPSRFFYCAKASRSERNAGLEGMEEKESRKYRTGNINNTRKDDGRTPDKKATNSHPTVKPIALFEWLIRLVTREGQIILDPFIGSGTTAIAAHKTGRKCIGIERESEYLIIAKKRVDYWNNKPQQKELRL